MARRRQIRPCGTRCELDIPHPHSFSVCSFIIGKARSGPLSVLRPALPPTTSPYSGGGGGLVRCAWCAETCNKHRDEGPLLSLQVIAWTRDSIERGVGGVDHRLSESVNYAPCCPCFVACSSGPARRACTFCARYKLISRLTNGGFSQARRRWWSACIWGARLSAVLNSLRKARGPSVLHLSLRATLVIFRRIQRSELEAQPSPVPQSYRGRIPCMAPRHMETSRITNILRRKRTQAQKPNITWQ